jgi:hypothetical protein
MKTIHIFLLLTAVCALLVAGAPKTAVSKAAPAVVAVDDLSAAANQELAAARRATAQYHDIQQALDDGYVLINCVPGEGFHFRQPQLFDDCEFDPEQPEILHYVLNNNGEFKLIGVEYLVRKSCSGFETQPPEGFSGDADEWEAETPQGIPVWALNAWIWQGVPEGVFAFRSDKFTCP